MIVWLLVHFASNSSWFDTLKNVYILEVFQVHLIFRVAILSISYYKKEKKNNSNFISNQLWLESTSSLEKAWAMRHQDVQGRRESLNVFGNWVLYIRDISTSIFALGSTIIVFSHVMECASSRDYSVFYQVHEAASMTICHSALLRGILPPLLNRYTQDNNVQIWACEPAKLPYRLFNICADTYEYQV